MQPLLDWLFANSLFVSSMAAASVLLLGMTLLATPWVVSRLPRDYLLQRLESPTRRGIRHGLTRIMRGIAGLLIGIVGLIMMVTPGPGVVMLLLAVSVADFPGKNRLLVHLATRPSILASLNWMRHRHGKPPFIHPDAGHRNAGHRNAGHRNAGHRNAGHRDAGHRDAGHRDTE